MRIAALPRLPLPVLGLTALVLTGCASSFSMRTLPAETPAAQNALAVRNAQALEALAKQEAAPGPQTAAQAQSAAGASIAAGAPTAAAPQDSQPLVPLTAADVPSLYTYDPWERFNRFMYRFNARFDEAILLPAADTYRRVPAPIRSGIHNFFANLSEVITVVNYGLQIRPGCGAVSLGRFVVNSTVGIGGLLDVASRLRMRCIPTGFSETLSTWGAHPGPYLVLPILGPSTLRDSVGYLGDYGVSYGVNIADLYRGYQSYAVGTTNAVDTRANVSFRYYATGSPFEYEVVRFLYVRKRLIEDEALRGPGKPRPRDPGEPAGR